MFRGWSTAAHAGPEAAGEGKHSATGTTEPEQPGTDFP